MIIHRSTEVVLFHLSTHCIAIALLYQLWFMACSSLALATAAAATAAA